MRHHHVPYTDDVLKMLRKVQKLKSRFKFPPFPKLKVNQGHFPFCTTHYPSYVCLKCDVIHLSLVRGDVKSIARTQAADLLD